MKAFIADNPPGKHGVHAYTPEEYGIEPEAVRRDAQGLHRAASSSPPNRPHAEPSSDEVAGR